MSLLGHPQRLRRSSQVTGGERRKETLFYSLPLIGPICYLLIFLENEKSTGDLLVASEDSLSSIYPPMSNRASDVVDHCGRPKHERRSQMHLHNCASYLCLCVNTEHRRSADTETRCRCIGWDVSYGCHRVRMTRELETKLVHG